MIATIATQVVRGWGRVLGRLTHPSASAVTEPAEGSGLDSLRGRSYCLLVSRRRDGRRVATPLWFALAGDRLLFRTDAESPKVARLRREPDVLVAPCDVRGRPLGPALAVRARRLTEPAEMDAAERAIGEAYGLRGRIWNRLVRISGLEAACYELVAAPASKRSRSR